MEGKSALLPPHSVSASFKAVYCSGNWEKRKVNAISNEPCLLAHFRNTNPNELMNSYADKLCISLQLDISQSGQTRTQNVHRQG